MLRISVTAYQGGGWNSIDTEDFERRFLEICQAHRAQGRALAFAFILFDRLHPFVRSALAQEHYWDALDQLSGRHLSVFSFDARGSDNGPIVEGRAMLGIQSARPDRLGEALSKYFPDVASVTLPCVLFFQVDGDKLIDSVAVSLTTQGLAETYRELEAVIGCAAAALSRVTDENAENAQQIFNLIERALQDRRERLGLIRLYHAARPIAEMATAVQVMRPLWTAIAN